MATLLDRFVLGDHMILRVQMRNGTIEDVRLPNESAGVREYAGCIWGGNPVPVTRAADGTLVLDCEPDLMSHDEMEALDRADELRGARKLAAGASDDEIEAVLDEPMSANQRRRALAALAR